MQMKIAIVPNLTKKGAKECTRNVAKIIAQYGGQTLLLEESKELCQEKHVALYKNIKELAAHSDIMITVGGDGTIIRVAKYAAVADKPLLGINLGRIGFVAGLEPHELSKLELLFKNEYTCETRMMLKATLTHKEEKHVFYALNDVTVSRGALSKMIDLSVSLSEKEICEYRADGLLFSTPTGSTAYALSAGGPVIQPHMQCILLTPICSHSLFSRSVLFCAHSKLTVKAARQEHAEVFLTVDGQEFVPVCSEDIIEIEKADMQTKLISLHNKSFYRVLSEKLSEHTG
mgnify:FL=1